MATLGEYCLHVCYVNVTPFHITSLLPFGNKCSCDCSALFLRRSTSHFMAPINHTIIDTLNLYRCRIFTPISYRSYLSISCSINIIIKYSIYADWECQCIVKQKKCVPDGRSSAKVLITYVILRHSNHILHHYEIHFVRTKFLPL